MGFNLRKYQIKNVANWQRTGRIFQLVKFHSGSHAEYDIQEIRDDEEVFWCVDLIKTPDENDMEN